MRTNTFTTMVRGSALLVFGILLALVLKVSGCTSSRTIDDQQKKDMYVIAYPDTWSHIQLYGTERSLVGFSSDVFYGISGAAKIPIRLVVADTNNFPEFLIKGSVDGVITAMPVDTMTEHFYEFSQPYFVSGIVVVVGENSPHTRLEDLRNAEIAYDISEGVDITLGARHSWLLRPYESTSKALEDVISGKVDGMLLNSIDASRLKRSLYRSKIRILSPFLVTQNIRLAVQRGKNHELITLFNQGIQEFVKSGEYQKLLEYWDIDTQLPGLGSTQQPAGSGELADRPVPTVTGTRGPSTGP